ncbi:MAG TPA: PAS domain S-box protein, partial [Polyangiaceae bacterium]|nr:PAS domain S-box protein [Polyangiaceae bacterium]
SRTGLLYAVTSSIVLLSLAAAQAAGYLLTPAVAYDATAALFVTLAALVVTGGVGYLSTLVRDAIAARAETSESLYAEVVRTAPEALVTVDRDGRVRGINPAGELLFGQGAAALEGRRVVELPGLEHLGEPGGEAVRLSAVRRADGTTRDVEVEARPLPLAGGPGLRVSVRDVTERLRAERERDQLAAELVQAQRLESIGLLAGGVAHDFNNLLTVVLGNSELLRRGRGDAAEAAHLLGEIEDAARRGAELTGQLLAFGQRQALKPRHVRPSAVVRAMRGLLRRLLTEDVALEVDAAAEGVARADPGQLGRVLVNLVVNARDAMPRGGTLRVATEDVTLDQERGAVPAGAYVRLSVTDSGVGMDPETVRRIFDPFFSTKGPGR